MNFKDSPYLVEIFDYDVLHLQLNTPLFILALVLVVMYFMNRWLFGPVMRNLAAREGLMTRLSEQTAAHRDEVAALMAAYGKHLEQAREEVARVRQEGRRESQQAVTAVLAQARQEAQADLAAALAELSGEVERAAGQLRQDAQRLAESVVNRILSV